MIASLKSSSKFKSVQEAFKSLGYDTTPDSVKIDRLTAEVEQLKNVIKGYESKFEEMDKTFALFRTKHNIQ